MDPSFTDYQSLTASAIKKMILEAESKKNTIEIFSKKPNATPKAKSKGRATYKKSISSMSRKVPSRGKESEPPNSEVVKSSRGRSTSPSENTGDNADDKWIKSRGFHHVTFNKTTGLFETIPFVEPGERTSRGSSVSGSVNSKTLMRDTSYGHNLFEKVTFQKPNDDLSDQESSESDFEVLMPFRVSEFVSKFNLLAFDTNNVQNINKSPPPLTKKPPLELKPKILLPRTKIKPPSKVPLSKEWAAEIFQKHVDAAKNHSIPSDLRLGRDYQQVDEQDPFLPPTAASQAIAARSLHSQGSYGSSYPYPPTPQHSTFHQPPFYQPLHVEK